MAANPLPTPTLTLATEKTPTEATVRCSGRITMENAAQLRETARALIAENKRLVIDLSDVNYLDSSGLGMIVGVYVSALPRGETQPRRECGERRLAWRSAGRWHSQTASEWRPRRARRPH